MRWLSYLLLGSARMWSDRERVAVTGAGGSLGADVFGQLQRAAPNNIFSGLGDPRGVVGTNIGSTALNKRLGGAYVLAFAPESLLRLCPLLDDSTTLERSFRGCSAAVISTCYSIERAGVGQDPPLEFYMDCDVSERADSAYKPGAEGPSPLAPFRAFLSTAVAMSLQHLVVIETPGTTAEQRGEVLAELAESKIPATFVTTPGGLSKNPRWTFKAGVPSTPSGLRLQLIPGLDPSTLPSSDSGSEGAAVSREDLASVVVQSIQALPWSESRILHVSSGDQPGTVGSQKQAFLSTIGSDGNGDDPAKVWIVGSSKLEAGFRSLLP